MWVLLCVFTACVLGEGVEMFSWLDGHSFINYSVYSCSNRVKVNSQVCFAPKRQSSVEHYFNKCAFYYCMISTNPIIIIYFKSHYQIGTGKSCRFFFTVIVYPYN